jgi:protein-tyrosine phosphatase
MHYPPLSCVNFRALGDVERVRPGSLFRSGDLSDLSHSDAKFLVEGLGVALYIDLRSEREQEGAPPTELLRAGITWHRSPMQGADTVFRSIRIPKPDDYTELYLRMLVQDQQPIRDCLSLLTVPSLGSVVFGCHAGKDRTGVLAAVILGLLGASSEEISDDFASSFGRLFDSIDHFRPLWEAKGLSKAEYSPRIECQAEIMRSFCAAADLRFEGWVAYVRSIGLSNRDILSIRRNYQSVHSPAGALSERSPDEDSSAHSTPRSKLF